MNSAKSGLFGLTAIFLATSCKPRSYNESTGASTNSTANAGQSVFSQNIPKSVQSKWEMMR
ncbi:hypothetical protein EBR21_10660, partial [bacterium]|nr:hypothetical protein [bacterium]